MKNFILFKSIMTLVSFLALTACPPYAHEENPLPVTQTSANSDAINQQLSKTSTGQQTLNSMNALVNRGYTIQIQLLSQAEIQNINGHSGGGYKIDGNTVSIYLNNALSITDQSHAVAHEVVHINDDLEIDQFLIQYPHVKSSSEDLITRYKTTSLSSFDERVISYVIGTLFCAEARAYTINQQLANEGLNTELFAKGNTLPQFIDQNYISRFGTQYGSNANAMSAWCLSQSSMTDIQYQYIW
ncbi:MAG: hypothetical protein A2622_03995 [Bdellovibrionales bacterium RIFCSPHIGHO2_01_FULL_40_29]|nr:MAG: hypothetical protein A2622_03995 [Bdellovibrionales bacterium RIFCSPHIGHO2_01_FULL_40_29]OFZ35327.1 MAG: hypothetical protein A3D17_08035 [Bdellovibrionales bacterium RIFCSPHIGHO2_02_FULL_40_15]